MKRNNARIAALALVLLAVLAVAGTLMLRPDGQEAAPQEGNLLVNGEFLSTTDGIPDGWTTGMWVTSAGVSYLEATRAPDGTCAVLVENAAANDARFEQTVSVRENTTYRLSARVMAQGCDESQTGANVSFLGIYGTSEDVHDTGGQWQQVTLYGRTGKGQKEITVCVRLGGYGSETTGKAWFTDVELCEAGDVPMGVSVLDLTTPEAKKASSVSGKTGGLSDHAIALLLGAAAVYLFIAAAVAATLLRPQSATLEHRSRGGVAALCVLLAAAFFVRLVLAMQIEGYGVDMGCFAAWAGRMASGGPASFYEAGYFCDYPPAYMLVLGLLGLIANALHIALSSMSMQVLIKLVPVACDLALAALCYREAHRRLNERAALGVAALIALNPAFIVTGSCWGQIDSVLCALLVLLLLYAQEGRWRYAIPVFALAVLAKPQAGLLAPLGVAALVKDVRQKRPVREILIGLGAGVAVTVAIVLPFSLKQENPFWLVDVYVNTLSSYDFATLSTGNLMFLLGGNWAASDTALLGPVTYGMLGGALMALSFLAGIVVYLRGEGRSRLFLSAALTMQLIYALGGKMHERYILPALALLLIAYVQTGDARLLASCVISSAAAAVNIGVVLAFDYLIAPNLWLGYGIGVVQLLGAGLTVLAAVDIVWRGHVVSLPVAKHADGGAQGGFAAEARMRQELLNAPDAGLHMTPRDWLVMLGITALYAVVGFYNLGATTAPQTGYTSSAAGESIVLDLGEMRENFHIYYYGGISNTAFSFAVSEDGVFYDVENDAFFDQGECFKWQALRRPVYKGDTVTGATGDMMTFSGRYIRVSFKGAGSALWEVAAVDDAGTPYPVVSATARGAREGRADDPNAIIDEQDTVPEKPSYMNSMYFDEIYHGRTGYEHAHSLKTYETTHPPLGKVFMSWCIRLMGMTPFAWRFAGALTGVLMLPALYLLAKQLMGKTRWAALCTFLLATDCMHFTQTRIATIDSFPVLFILLMFLCMARWTRMSFYHTKLWRTLVPLALSGAFMGLAIASKWIGCYSAVGLAALFFARFYTLWRQSRYAQAHRREHPAFARAADSFARNGAITIAACCVFFVAVPVVIYGLSYIPYLRAYGRVTLSMETMNRIIDAQVYMFDYHKNLIAEHYFASPWYEWPLIIKPMWYYQADYKGAGMASSILAFGNPAVWWTGLFGILFVLGYSLYRNTLPALRIVRGRDDEYDRAMPVIAVGFLSAYLPWVLISRLTFIYHYFASVPFIILATAQGLRYLERKAPRTARVLTVLLCVAALALFIAYYPLASGLEVPRAWCDAVSVFDNWMWY